MHFPPMHRHAPKRNVLPTHPLRDETARREIARLSAQLDELRRDVQVQFTRIAQMQADLDEIKRLLRGLKPPPG
jgi:hypothetical protein